MNRIFKYALKDYRYLKKDAHRKKYVNNGSSGLMGSIVGVSVVRMLDAAGDNYSIKNPQFWLVAVCVILLGVLAGTTSLHIIGFGMELPIPLKLCPMELNEMKKYVVYESRLIGLITAVPAMFVMLAIVLICETSMWCVPLFGIIWYLIVETSIIFSSKLKIPGLVKIFGVFWWAVCLSLFTSIAQEYGEKATIKEALFVLLFFLVPSLIIRKLYFNRALKVAVGEGD